jgi:hypothetical protein
LFALAAVNDKLLNIVPGEGVVREYRVPPSRKFSRILPARGSVYLIEEALGTVIVHRVDLSSGALSMVAHLDHFGGGSLSLNASGRFLAYTHARETANDLAWVRL